MRTGCVRVPEGGVRARRHGPATQAAPLHASGWGEWPAATAAAALRDAWCDWSTRSPLALACAGSRFAPCGKRSARPVSWATRSDTGRLWGGCGCGNRLLLRLALESCTASVVGAAARPAARAQGKAGSIDGGLSLALPADSLAWPQSCHRPPQRGEGRRAAPSAAGWVWTRGLCGCGGRSRAPAR